MGIGSFFSTFYRNRIRAPQWSKTFNDCAKQVNTTPSPDVFFPRYRQMIHALEQLAGLNSPALFKGTQPSDIKKTLEKNQPEIVSAFLDRYFAFTEGEISAKKDPDTRRILAEHFKNRLEPYATFFDSEQNARIDEAQAKFLAI